MTRKQLASFSAAAGECNWNDILSVASSIFSACTFSIIIVTDCCRENDKSKLEELVLACLRSGHSLVLEKIAGRMLDLRKLIDWKVSGKEFELY